MFKEFFPYPDQHPEPLTALALELMQTLAKHFPIAGQMEISRTQDHPSFSYRSSAEGIALLQEQDEIEMISIQDHHFSLLLEHINAGIELVYIPLDPLENKIYQDIRQLCLRVLDRLSAELP